MLKPKKPTVKYSNETYSKGLLVDRKATKTKVNSSKGNIITN